MTARPRLGVSSCLLGEPVRHNGGHSRSRFLTDVLGPHVDWVPCCPEIAAGLGAPRETLRLEAAPDADGTRLMTRTSRRDLTGDMRELAVRHGATLDVDGYVFKSKSPSCGLHGIPVHPPGGPPLHRRNRGMFAAAILQAHPLLPVEDDGRLNDALLRESFIERIFAHARLRELLSGPWRPRDLVAFHARHKMQLLSHDPARYRQAGRIVSEAGVLPREELARAYAALFREAFAAKASTGRNVDVLLHCMGMLGLDVAHRDDLLHVIDAYRAGLVPLSVPTALVRHHATGWIAGQTYLAPYPDDLRLRHHLAA
ncbi:YbgA family protein [Nonomuraea sediminis]|uniref:YbgA family protein n=1 Tax=Nonomuraea sediminis TaxID=2835864 RepID=UPI001BDDA00D|nr:DUF523 and DUF1722 domain-containing protein [Nonomuraea sediminis]